jgi:hypothetical protein
VQLRATDERCGAEPAVRNKFMTDFNVSTHFVTAHIKHRRQRLKSRYTKSANDWRKEKRSFGVTYHQCFNRALSLAIKHAGRFVTFDDADPLSAVLRAEEEHLAAI